VTVTRRSAILGAMLAATEAALGARPAAADELDATLAKIAEARKKLKTLRADFVQVRTIGLLATKVKSKGRLTLVMPDRLRWDLLPPDDVTYWIGPKGLAMRNEEGIKRIGKSAAGRFASVLGDLRTMLGGDLRRLRKRYQLSIDEEKGKSVIVAKPKDKAVKKHIKALTLVTDPKKALMDRVTITENNGDRSVITFSKHVKNEPVDEQIITPPSSG